MRDHLRAGPRVAVRHLAPIGELDAVPTAQPQQRRVPLGHGRDLPVPGCQPTDLSRRADHRPLVERVRGRLRLQPLADAASPEPYAELPVDPLRRPEGAVVVARRAAMRSLTASRPPARGASRSARRIAAVASRRCPAVCSSPAWLSAFAASASRASRSASRRSGMRRRSCCSTLRVTREVAAQPLAVRERRPADRVRVLPVAGDDAGRVGDIGA